MKKINLKTLLAVVIFIVAFGVLNNLLRWVLGDDILVVVISTIIPISLISYFVRYLFKESVFYSSLYKILMIFYFCIFVGGLYAMFHYKEIFVNEGEPAVKQALKGVINSGAQFLTTAFSLFYFKVNYQSLND